MGNCLGKTYSDYLWDVTLVGIYFFRIPHQSVSIWQLGWDRQACYRSHDETQ